jgi:predicted nucleic acid-binding protein
VAVICDTMLAQRVVRNDRALAYARRVAGTRDGLAVSPLSIEQQLQGWWKRGREDIARETDALYTALIGDGVLELVDVGRNAASMAGWLRGLQPSPPLPPKKRKGARPTKPERRVSWAYDVLIAASAWASGHRLATEDKHFGWLSDRIADRFPDDPLELEDPLPPALSQVSA